MSEQAVLWLFGVLLAMLGALVVALARIFWNKLSSIDSGALASFVARDAEREKQWMIWRETVNHRLDSKRADIKDHEHRITRLERNGGSH